MIVIYSNRFFFTFKYVVCWRFASYRVPTQNGRSMLRATSAFSYNHSAIIANVFWDLRRSKRCRWMINFAMATNVEPILFKYAPQATTKDYKAITLANECYCLLPFITLIGTVAVGIYGRHIKAWPCHPVPYSNSSFCASRQEWMNFSIIVRWIGYVKIHRSHFIEF